jgi:hypothetical protein
MTQPDMDINDIWRDVTQEFYDKDVNGNGIVSEDEYGMHELYTLIYTMGNLVAGNIPK